MLCVNWWLMLKTLCWLLQSAQKNECTLTVAAVQTDVAMNQCIIILKLMVLGFKDYYKGHQ